jgi:methionine-rich copper-binding protein CopC
VLAAALAAILIVPATGSAHSDAERTSPADGETVRTALRTVTVWFAAPVRSGSLRVTRAGRRVAVRSGTAANRLRGRLQRVARPGSYLVTWRVVSADGHRATGSFVFRVRRG